MSDGPLVSFRSIPDFWQREYIGNKPNTVRILDDAEYSQKLDFPRACLMAGEPATICIVRAGSLGEDGVFFRRITDISQVGTLLGQTMWCISWQHEDGAGSYTEGADDDC